MRSFYLVSPVLVKPYFPGWHIANCKSDSLRHCASYSRHPGMISAGVQKILFDNALDSGLDLAGMTASHH
jgi:hypothetical protein